MDEHMLQCMVPQTDYCLYFAACVNSFEVGHNMSSILVSCHYSCAIGSTFRQVLLQSDTSIINLLLDDEARKLQSPTHVQSKNCLM